MKRFPKLTDSFRTFSNEDPRNRLALLLQSIISEYANALYFYIPKCAKECGVTYPYDGPFVSFKIRDPKKYPMEAVIFFGCAKNLMAADSANFDEHEWDSIAHNMDILRLNLFHYSQMENDYIYFMENSLIPIAIKIMEHTARAYSFSYGEPRIICDPFRINFNNHSFNIDSRINHRVGMRIAEFNLLLQRLIRQETVSQPTGKPMTKIGAQENPFGAPFEELKAKVQKTKAELLDLLLEQPQSAPKKRSGPKAGPRKATIDRRAAIQILAKDGIKDLPACMRLNARKIKLPSDKLQTMYEGDWRKWYQADTPAFRKQWSRDLKTK